MIMMHALIPVAVATLGALIPAASAQCNRAALQAAADRYVETRRTGLTDFRSLLGDNATYIENNKVTALAGGVLAQPMTPAHNRSTVDTTACATYTELIVTDPSGPYVIGTQIRYNATASDDSTAAVKVAVVDSVVSTTGSWMFNATKTLAYVLQENWGAITPASKQDTRAALQSAADLYLDLWGPDTAAAAAAAKVPWGTPCDRLEGSSYTGSGKPTDSCNVGIPTGTNPPNTDRRYVIDEVAGSVSVLCTFQTMRNAPDSHEFRVEGGKLRYVHTMTVCACGS